MDQATSNNKMAVMPIPKLIVSMSLPMMASMLFQAMYNVVDSMFVAKLSQDAMNAVSLSFPIQTIIIGCAAGTGVGMNALISRSLGEGNRKRANQIANTGIFLFIMMSAIFAILGLLISKPFFRFQTANERIIEYGSSYIQVCLCCSFAAMGQICGENLLQSTGRTNLAMIPQITGAVFNMCMDPVMIFGLFGFPRLEVRGAAIATMGGQTLALILAFVLNVKKNPDIRLSLKEIKPRPKIIKKIYRIGVPSILMQTVGSLLTFFMNKILIGFTEAATAVFGAYYKIQSFIFLPAIGINNALVPVISFNYGAKNKERVLSAIKAGIAGVFTLMLIGTIMFEFFPAPLLRIFSPTEEMLAVGVPAFRIIAIHFIISSFGVVVVAVFQALGRAMYSLITATLRQLVFLLPLAYLFSTTQNLKIVWLAFPISEILSGFISFSFLKKVLRTSDFEK